MKKLLIFPALLFSLLAAGQPGWRQGLKYRLSVKLDDQQQALDGKMNLCYTNHSPDSLHFIWFHVWPNAYRNDKTSYSDQLLGNGKPGFYFSEKDKRGYINRMEFRINGMLADMQDHPEYIDVIKLVLPNSVAPGDSVLISAVFHVKLPYNFSGFGQNGNHFQLNNWYPEPAVYDQTGWHPLPFLEQGGGYHETADFDVTIEVPQEYSLVTGSLPDTVFRNQPGNNKTSVFSLKNANGFAWIANKHFLEKKDTVMLESGRVITLNLYYPAADSSRMSNRMQEKADPVSKSRQIIRQLSGMISEFPYKNLNLAAVMHAPEESFSGMVMLDREHLFDLTDKMLIEQLAGQWFQASCPSNERLYPWMWKGFVQYYYQRLQTPFSRRLENRFPLSSDHLWLKVSEKKKTTQPINTPAIKLSRENYTLVAAMKSACWLKSLEDSLGRQVLDSAMHRYFETWKFAHPGPEDFKIVLERTSHRDLGAVFNELNTTQSFFIHEPKRKWKFAFQYYPGQFYTPGAQYNYINAAPVLGYNSYDHAMAGLLIHNYNLPENNFQFLLAPLYSWTSKTIRGLSRISYSWYPEEKFRKITIGVNGSHFSDNAAKDSTGKNLFETFTKVSPYLRIDFNKQDARSTLDRWMDLKSYLINEQDFGNFAFSPVDSLIHPNSVSGSFRYLNQLSINIRDTRVLYPYDARLEIQQSNLFYRINLNADYFFNYPSGGGMRVRFFAAKFGVWNNHTKQDLSRYEPKLLGVTGEEDYTYSQYFIGRSASDAIENSSISNSDLAAQQISIRDGGLKMRIDPYDYLQGRSANWVSALNFSTSLPAKLFPVPLPVRLFFDVGTYAESWKTNAQTSRFLYTGGIQLSLFKNVLNIYAPLVYSSDFREAVKTETFWKKITFSIDIQHINYKQLLHQRPIYD